MPANKNIVPSSSNRSSVSSSAQLGEQDLDGIVLNSFKLKPTGTGATRNTLVENDSLSSYSWPEETSRQHGGKRQTGEKAANGASQNLSENGSGDTSSIAPKRHTVLDMEDNQNAETLQEPAYVEAYMKFMYWTCVSPFNPTRSVSSHDATSRCDSVLRFVQKVFSLDIDELNDFSNSNLDSLDLLMLQKLQVFFATLIGFSFVKSFCQVKFYVVYYMAYPDMESFIDMMFNIMNAGTKMYYVYIFVMLQKMFTRMLNSLDKLRDFRTQISHANKYKNCKTMPCAIRLGISSILMTFIQTTWHYTVREWTPQECILQHSRTMALGLWVWSKENVRNDTWVETIKHEYQSDANTTNILLGAFGMILHLCSGLHNEATGDLMQTQAETVREEMQNLQKQINKTENDEQNATLAGFLRENGEWAHSRLLTQAMNACNDTLDPIMKYKHVNNLMLYVFFVLNLFDGDYSVAYLAYLLYDICKSSYTYRIAAEASTLNDSKRDWICRLAWKSNDNEFLKRVPLMLVEIKAKPIGLGKGQFMINESFLYRFLGWVGSVFVLQAQSREGRAE